MSLRHLYRNLNILGVYPDLYNSNQPINNEKTYREHGHLNKYYGKEPSIMMFDTIHIFRCEHDVVNMVVKTCRMFLCVNGINIMVNFDETSPGTLDIYCNNKSVHVKYQHMDKLPNIMMRLVYVYGNNLEMIKKHLIEV